MLKREFQNPQGLNEILSEILGHPVQGDWDRDIPSEFYVGRWKKEDTKKILKGRTGQVWGNMLEKHACSYLAEKLEDSGWRLLHNHKIGENEYDCVGWKDRPIEGSPDLAVEMYFPTPKEEVKYEVKNIREKIADDVTRLEKIHAKYKFIVIGVPRGKRITTIERPRSDIKVVYQEYRFTKTREEKTKKYVRRHCSCPYCKAKPVVVIWERGGRLRSKTFIRHRSCPFCGKDVEIRVHEHLGRKGQFQREVTLRKSRTVEDLGKEGGPQRSIEIFRSYP